MRESAVSISLPYKKNPKEVGENDPQGIMHNTWILDPCLSGVGGSAQRNGVMRSGGKSCQ